MYIHEAIKKTSGSEKYIYLAERSNVGASGEPLFKVEPTNTSDCCIVVHGGKKASRRWNPNKSDLLSGLWEVCD